MDQQEDSDVEVDQGAQFATIREFLDADAAEAQPRFTTFLSVSHLDSGNDRQTACPLLHSPSVRP